MRTLTLLLFLLPSFLFAQLSTTSIEVRGSATRSVAPTEVSVKMDLQVIRLNYSEAIKDLDKQVNDLHKTLRKEKVDEQGIRSSDFMVGKNTIWESRSQKDSGYFARQTVHIRIPFKQKQLGEVLTAISESKLNPSVSLNFGLDSSRSVTLRQDLIKSAVRDARLKAELIVSETTYAIFGIHEIKYGNTSGGVNTMRTAGLAEAVASYQPQDLNLTESVTIRYYLRKKE